MAPRRRRTFQDIMEQVREQHAEGVAALLFGADGEPTDEARPALAGVNHPDTSKAAAASLDTRNAHARVVEYLDAAGADGATSGELVEAIPTLGSVQLASSRLYELRGEDTAHPDRVVARLLGPNGKPVTRRGATGRGQQVHVLVTAELPAGYTLQALPTVRLCGHCGQVVRRQPRSTTDPANDVNEDR